MLIFHRCTKFRTAYPEPNPSVSATHAQNIPDIVRPPVLGILGIRLGMPSEPA
jgi:hypothetical protein